MRITYVAPNSPLLFPPFPGGESRRRPGNRSRNVKAERPEEEVLSSSDRHPGHVKRLGVVPARSGAQ